MRYLVQEHKKDSIYDPSCMNEICWLQSDQVHI